MNIDPSTAPPPVLEMARVLAYALLDSEPAGAPHHQLVGEHEEAALVVSRLALCETIDGNLKGILLFHCNCQWQVLGVTGSETLESAMSSAERAYSGVSAHWVRMDVPIEAARGWLNEHFKDVRCAFCDRDPGDVKTLVQGKSGAHICNHCVDKFCSLIRQPLEGGEAA